MEEIVFLNGKFLAKGEVRLSLIRPGFLYSWGLFESMRSYNNRIVYLNAHLKRIKNACRLINITFPYPPARLKKIIEQAVKINNLKDAYVRLTLWKKTNTLTDTLIIVKEYKPISVKKYSQGFRCWVSSLRQCENSFLAQLKTTNYLLYQIAYSQAKDKGFDEAIILNNRGYICEGSRSNLFMVKNKEVFTPALECGCLDGITRGVISGLAKRYNIKIHQGNFTLQDLYESDEAFLTNSLMGIMPIQFIETLPLGQPRRLTRSDNRVGCTRFFMEKYNLLLRGL